MPDKLDGKFGKAQLKSKASGDDWFLASVMAVANDLDGNSVLSKHITKAEGGHMVNFPAAFPSAVFISDEDLTDCLKTYGGDADTRLLELGAEKYFSQKSSWRALFVKYWLKKNKSDDAVKAQKVFDHYNAHYGIDDPETYNPMKEGCSASYGLFLLTGKVPDLLIDNPIKKDIIDYLEKHYVKDDWDRSTVVIKGKKGPLGDEIFAKKLVRAWDIIRTQITSDGSFNKYTGAFLFTLRDFLLEPNENTTEAFVNQATSLPSDGPMDPLRFAQALELVMPYLTDEQRKTLADAINELLLSRDQCFQGWGSTKQRVNFNAKSKKVGYNCGDSVKKLGYLGFGAYGNGAIKDVNEELDTFTYTTPEFPTLEMTGVFSELVKEVMNGEVKLVGAEVESLDCPRF
jgi:hypothetical protein